MLFDRKNGSNWRVDQAVVATFFSQEARKDWCSCRHLLQGGIICCPGALGLLPQERSCLQTLVRLEIIDQYDVGGTLEAISGHLDSTNLELVRTGVGEMLASISNTKKLKVYYFNWTYLSHFR